MKNGSPRGLSCSRRRRSSRGAVTSWRGGGRNCRGFGSTRRIDSRPTRGAPRWQTFSKGARNSSSTTSCSGPTTLPGCPSCSAIADGFNGSVVHLANHDVTLSAVSRAPLAKLQAYKRRMGWTFPWASSLGSDFNFDFNVWFTNVQQREGSVEYNYRREAAWQAARGFGGWRRGARRRARGHYRNRRGHVYAREAGYERVRTRGRRRLPRLFHLCARTGRPLGHVPVARPRTQGTQRDWRLVAPTRRVRQALSDFRKKISRHIIASVVKNKAWASKSSTYYRQQTPNRRL